MSEQLWSDHWEPEIRKRGTMYMASVPGIGDVRAWLVVSEDGHTELWDFYWFGIRDKKGGYRLSDPEDKKIWDAMQEVWDWLSEWEFIELKPIGPEDSEYFATEKLLNR